MKKRKKPAASFAPVDSAVSDLFAEKKASYDRFLLAIVTFQFLFFIFVSYEKYVNDVTVMAIPLGAWFIAFTFLITFKIPIIGKTLESNYAKGFVAALLCSVWFIVGAIASQGLGNMFGVSSSLLPYTKVYLTFFLIATMAMKYNIVSFCVLAVSHIASSSAGKDKLIILFGLLVNFLGIWLFIGSFCKYEDEYNYPSLKVFAFQADFTKHNCLNIGAGDRVLFTGDGNAVIVSNKYMQMAAATCEYPKDPKFSEVDPELKSVMDATIGSYVPPKFRTDHTKAYRGLGVY